MVDTVDGARRRDRGVQAEVRHRRVPAGARRSLSPASTRRRSSTRTRTGTRRTSWAPARSSSPDYEVGQSIKGERNPDYYHKGQPYLDGFAASSPPSSRCASTRSAATAPRSSSAACRRRRATSWSRSSATRSRCRRATGTAATSSRPTTRRSRSTTCACAGRWPGDRPVEGRAGAVQDRHRQDRRRHRLPRLAAGGDQGGAAADRRLLARHREVARRGQAAAEGGRAPRT